MSEKTLDLTVDEWMGMYHIAADRADKAEAEVERLERVLSASKVVVGFRGCHDENSAWSIRALESAIKRYELEQEGE